MTLNMYIITYPTEMLPSMHLCPGPWLAFCCMQHRKEPCISLLACLTDVRIERIVERV